MSEDETPCCRICLESTPPLLESLCDCKHSMGFVHKTCLESWLQHKHTLLKDANTLSSTTPTQECDVCRAPFKFKTREFISNENPTATQFTLRALDMFLKFILGVNETNALRNAPLAERVLYPFAFFGCGIYIVLLCDWNYWPYYSMMLSAPWTTVSLVSLVQLYTLGLDSIPWGLWRLYVCFIAWKMNMLPRYRMISNTPFVPAAQTIADALMYLIAVWALGDMRLLLGLAVIAHSPLRRAIFNRWSPERHASTRVLSVAILGTFTVSAFIFGNLVLLLHVFTWTWQWWEFFAFIAVQLFVIFFFGIAQRVFTTGDAVHASFDTRQVQLVAQESTLGVQLAQSVAVPESESAPPSSRSDPESSPGESGPNTSSAVTVAQVVSGSTAHLAGVRAGDHIIAINNQPLVNPQSFLQYPHRVGDHWAVQRQDFAGQVQQVQLTLVPLA